MRLPIHRRPRFERAFVAAWEVLVAYVKVTLTEAVLCAVVIGTAAAIIGLAVVIWRRDVMGALVIGGAISVSILAACFFGVLLPTIVRAFKADPRIAAGPLVLASTDLVTLVSYLWLGSIVLGG